MRHFFRVLRPLFTTTSTQPTQNSLRQSKENLSQSLKWAKQHQNVLPTGFICEFVDEVSRRRQILQAKSNGQQDAAPRVGKEASQGNHKKYSARIAQNNFKCVRVHFLQFVFYFEAKRTTTSKLLLVSEMNWVAASLFSLRMNSKQRKVPRDFKVNILVGN